MTSRFEGQARTTERPVPGRPSERSLPLIQSKLAAPRSQNGSISRARVLALFDVPENSTMAMVAAPPGYGKTTAARDWCALRDEPLAWVTLDEGDNDPVRLWTYVAAAVDHVIPGLGESSRERLRRGEVGGAVEELADLIAASRRRLIVVLDDLHTITDADSLHSLDRFLDRRQTGCRLILITRTDPRLRLARPRAEGVLAEIRAGDLGFTEAEAREFLVERCGLPLSDDEIAVLMTRTEGWPVALMLASLWLRRVEDPRAALLDFGGDHRFVVDYLHDELLGSIDPAARDFLLQACVLGRFTAKLCDGVFGRTDSAAVIAELERSTLLITRLGRGPWYRVHALLADFARFHLRSLSSGAAEELHRRTADWLRGRGLFAEAIEHAAMAGDQEAVADILSAHHLPLIRSGGARTFLRWVRTLRSEQLLHHPELAVAAATVTSVLGHATLERRRLLDLADRGAEGAEEPVRVYVETASAMVRAATIEGNVGQAVIHGRRAVELAQAIGGELLVPALGGLARALYFAGAVDEAWSTALRALEPPGLEERRPGHALARSLLALAALARGQIETARPHAEAARAILADFGSRTWLGANAAVAWALLHAQEGRLADAERDLSYAERLFRDEVGTIGHTWSLILLARVRCSRGRLGAAADALASARSEMADFTDSGVLAELADDVVRELTQGRARAHRGEVLDLPSDAEQPVLQLLATDLSASEISAKLFLSPNTVRSHIRAIYRKLGVGSRADAVARAQTLGLLGETHSPR